MANISRHGNGYQARVRRRGYPLQCRTFPTRKEAAEWARALEHDMDEGRRVGTTRERRRTVSDMIDRYRCEVLPDYSPKERSQRDAKLAWWEEQLGAIRLTELTAADIAECRGKLKSEGGISGLPLGPATQTRYLATFKHALSTARREWEWLTNDPGQKVRAPKEPRGRVRYLSAEEKKRLLEACQAEPQLYALVMMALWTGARQGELLRLRWRDIDLLKSVAIVQKGKNDERRPLTLLEPVVAALRALPRRIDRDGVFLGERGGVSFPQEAWTEARKKAKLGDFRFHDLRHTFASYLAMSGATLAELTETLGHKTLAMVKRYAHLSPAHTSGVVRRMGEKFLA